MAVELLAVALRVAVAELHQAGRAAQVPASQKVEPLRLELLILRASRRQVCCVTPGSADGTPLEASAMVHDMWIQVPLEAC